MGPLAQAVAGDFITLAVILSARRLYVIRLRRRYVDKPRKRKRSGGLHQTVLAEGLEPYPGAESRAWEVTCGHSHCAGRKIVRENYPQALQWALAHEDDPEFTMFTEPAAAAAGKKGGKHHG